LRVFKVILNHKEFTEVFLSFPLVGGRLGTYEFILFFCLLILSLIKLLLKLCYSISLDLPCLEFGLKKFPEDIGAKLCVALVKGKLLLLSVFPR
jgi:hypothetical protein